MKLDYRKTFEIEIINEFAKILLVSLITLDGTFAFN